MNGPMSFASTEVLFWMGWAYHPMRGWIPPWPMQQIEPARASGESGSETE